MNEQQLIERIRSLYPTATVEVAGENCNFEVYVITEAFAGVKTLERQRSLLALFADEIGSGKLHALSIKARTPTELGGGAGLVQLGGTAG